MLGVKNYTREYVAACRARVERDIAAYSDLLGAAGEPRGSAGAAALAAFEGVFFNNLVLVLDACFVHRLRTIEGKDCNPLTEVRVLCNSLLQNGNVLTADKAIKLPPEKSVLGLREGDEISLTQADFLRLSEAFFAEIERKFV